MNNIWTILISIVVAVYLLSLWISDYRSKSSEKVRPLPGCTSCPVSWVIVASCLSVMIILVLTLGEGLLGITERQTVIPSFFLFAMLAASITEEIIFRGYFVVTQKGPWFFVLSILLFSLIFSICHPYLWEHHIQDPQGIELITTLRFNLELHSIYVTLSIFVLSVWFYIVRFVRWNPRQSLIPCFFAHATVNLTVFIIKYILGFVR